MLHDNDKRIRSTDIGLLLIRSVLAAVFIYHGSQKLFGAFGGYGVAGTAGFFEKLGIPFPTLSVYLAAGTEFFGGIALILVGGIIGRAVAAVMAFNMAVAILLVHRHAFGTQNQGMEFPLTLGVTLLGLVFTGLGRLTMTGLLMGPKGRPVPKGFVLAEGLTPSLVSSWERAGVRASLFERWPCRSPHPNPLSAIPGERGPNTLSIVNAVGGA